MFFHLISTINNNFFFFHFFLHNEPRSILFRARKTINFQMETTQHDADFEEWWNWWTLSAPCYYLKQIGRTFFPKIVQINASMKEDGLRARWIGSKTVIERSILRKMWMLILIRCVHNITKSADRCRDCIRSVICAKHIFQMLTLNLPCLTLFQVSGPRISIDVTSIEYFEYQDAYRPRIEIDDKISVFLHTGANYADCSLPDGWIEEGFECYHWFCWFSKGLNHLENRSVYMFPFIESAVNTLRSQFYQILLKETPFAKDILRVVALYMGIAWNDDDMLASDPLFFIRSHVLPYFFSNTQKNTV